MSNAFEAFGAANTRPVKSRTPRRLVEVRKEDAKLRKQAHASVREEIDKIIAGPHGAIILELRSRLRKLTFPEGPKLLVAIEANIDLRTAPIDVRRLALRMISKAIARVREGEGLPPFDDGCPGDPPRAMHVVKQLLGVQ